MNPPPLHAHDDDNDDEPVGLVYTRRQALGLFAAPALLWLAGCSSTEPTDGPTQVGSCVARPELTEGPYFVDEDLLRSDIRPDTASGTLAAGSAMTLTFVVGRISNATCAVLPNALVDVWHADANGDYSEFGGGAGQNFLRGQQVTDADGVARFTTVFPGWYAGRAVHIHFKVRSAAGASQTYEFTSQLFFDDSFTDTVYRTAPYSNRGTRTTRNATDGIYRQGGSQLVLDVAESGVAYAATFNLALEL